MISLLYFQTHCARTCFWEFSLSDHEVSTTFAIGFSQINARPDLSSTLTTIYIIVAERTSYFCLARKLIWRLWSSHIFTQWECHSTRVTSRGNIKGRANHFSHPSCFHAGLSSRTDLSTWQSTHSLSSFPSSRKNQPTWETTFTLLHWLSLTYFEQSTKHNEETSSNLWTVGVWEIIHSSFIFLSKPTDPRRNKWDIFNSCFDFSILIPVLTTEFQLLLLTSTF